MNGRMTSSEIVSTNTRPEPQHLDVKISLVNPRTLMFGFGFSLCIHTLAITLIGSEYSLRIPEYWYFAVCSFLFLGVCLTPLSGLFLFKRIDRYDPIFVYSAIAFSTGAGINLAYLLDPRYVLSYAKLQSVRMVGISNGDLLALLGDGLGILSLCTGIVVWQNRYIPIRKRQLPKGSMHTASAVAAGVLSIVAGIYGFSQLWAGRNLTDVFFRSVGYVWHLSEGQSYLVSLQKLPQAGVPLGLSGILVSRKLHSLASRVGGRMIIACAALLLLVPRYVSGSRIYVLFGVILLVYTLDLFGMRLSGSELGVMGLVLISAFALIALLRFSPIEAQLGDFTTPQGMRMFVGSLVSRRGSSISPLLDLDRVSTIGFIVKSTQNQAGYLYGASLASGLWNSILDLVAKTPGLDFSNHYMRYTYEYVNYWRWGSYQPPPGVGNRPPSLAGEFYMQGGWVALTLLSAVFGLFFRVLRRYMSSGRSNAFLKWIALYVLLLLAIYSPAELSELFRHLYVPILPIACAYCLARLSLIGGIRTARVEAIHFPE